MSTFETWKNFYNWGYCTKDALDLLVQLNQLTQEQEDEIIASKPDLTGRVVKPTRTYDNESEKKEDEKSTDDTQVTNNPVTTDNSTVTAQATN